MDETKETQALLALSEAREALVGAPDDASDERMKELRGKVQSAEREYRKAISDRVDAQAKAAEEAEKAANDGDGDGDDGIDAEERERRDLLGKSSLAAYITAAAVGQPIVGAERELSEAYGIPGAIPLQFFKPRVEERAQTDPPTTTDVVFHPTIHPLFDASVAPFLMVDMPMVEPGVQQYPVLETSLTASMQAKGGEAPETAAVYGDLLTASPKRLGGGYRLRREDLAILPRMESDLNRNIRMVLADTLDAQILNGDNTGANLNGILTQLTDAADPGAVVTFDSALKTYVDQIDGLLARGIPNVRALVGTDTVKALEVLFRSNDTAYVPSAPYLRMNTGGLRASNRIPDQSAGKVQKAVAYLDQSPDRTAVMPVWNGIEAIRDELSDSRKGEIIVTLFTLVGGPILTRKAAYKEIAFKLA